MLRMEVFAEDGEISYDKRNLERRTERQEWAVRSNYEKQAEMGRSYFLKYDQEQMVKKFSLRKENGWIYLCYLAKEYRIQQETAAVEEWTGTEWNECLTYTVVMTIYDMLCFGTEPFLPVFSGDWKPVGSFAAAGASPDPTVFSQRYADAFAGKTEQLRKACEALGGTLVTSVAGADVTAEIPAFPFFKVLLQFWDGDEEFAPQIRILWDSSTKNYLHFETTYYLQGDLLDRLLEQISPLPTA